MVQGVTVWITGLPGSGKATLARTLEERLLERGLAVERLDGGEIRTRWLPGLGCSTKDREGFIRFLGHVCTLLTRNGVITIAAAVSPYQELRNELRAAIGRFVEVYLKCPVAICEQRDTTGAYQKARSGQIKEFTGVSAAYEEPTNPELLLETDKESPEACCEKIIQTLEILGYIPMVEDREYSEEDEVKITKRLKDLGYL
jgi:adenylyl-sulfate kinase